MADVDVEIKFNSAGFQTILNSGPVRSMVIAEGGRIVSRCGGMAHMSVYQTVGMRGGPRPAVGIHTHAKTQLEAAVARKVLEGAI